MSQFWRQCAGQVVDGTFHLDQFLGGDDHQAVFLTERGSRQAAIKLVRSDPLADQLMERWRQAARLSHPHLLRLYSMGRYQLGEVPVLFLVMEYAEENLGQVTAQRVLTVMEIKDLLPPALDVLAYLHSKGFAHSNLKPANFLAVDGQLRISSDALCRVGEGFAQVPGAFTPPEAVTEGFSTASDVWSLGMTVVVALTQQFPRWSDGKSEPRLPAALPPEFTDFARHCLQKDPHNRWTISEISKWLKAGGIVERKPKRDPARKWLYACTAVLGLALAAVLVWPTLENPRPEAPGAPSVALDALKPHPAQPPPTEPPVAAPVKEKPSTAPTTPSGDVEHKVLPEVPEKARATIQGVIPVVVKVEVDSSGHVTKATLVSAGPSKYFAALAQKAAQEWTFTPQSNPAPRTWTLRFGFSNAGAVTSMISPNAPTEPRP